jgi:hypothetical protein
MWWKRNTLGPSRPTLPNFGRFLLILTALYQHGR